MTTAIATAAMPYWPTVHGLPVIASRFFSSASLGSSRMTARSALVALRPVMRRICASIVPVAEAV